MRLLRSAALGAAALACVALTAALTRPPQRLTARFADGQDGWQAVPPPTAPPTQIGLTEGPQASRSLRLRYTVTPKKLAGIIHPVDGLLGGGIRLRAKTDTPTTLVVGCIERDGSSYMRTLQTRAGEWVRFEAAFNTLTLSDDSRDENGALDLEQVANVVIADAGGFMPTTGMDRTLWLDDIDVGADVAGAGASPYTPLLPCGPPSASGSRATRGVRYTPGKFGRAMAADTPGAQGLVPVRVAADGSGWRWQQGAIEMWLCPTVDVAAIPDFSGIVSLQQEPFMPGFKGSLQLFMTGSHQLAFMLNGSMENLAASLPLQWKAGRRRHVAVTWGPAGMRIYLDGVAAGSGRITGGPSAPAGDLVVGSHAWTIVSSRPSMMAFDDLRVSSRQRSDAEIMASARRTEPIARDADTVALERFDGSPAPPAALTGGAWPWHTFRSGQPIALTVSGSQPVRGRIAEAGGRDSASLTPSAGALRSSAPATAGFYRVTAGTADEWLRVTPRAAIPRDPFFGGSACYAEMRDGERFFQLAREAGVQTLRLPFEWFEIEPQEGRFAWEKYDRIVAWAARHGVELIPTFIWEKPQPAWAGPGEAKGGLESQERYPPTDMARWRRFVGAVVARYKATIHWWIPANEPNLARYWHPKPDARAYTDLLRQTREAARQADPNARILGLSASGIDLRFMEECFKAGALQHCDAVGVHPYNCPRDPDEAAPINIMDPASRRDTWREGLRAAGALIRRYGGAQKLWLDEAGQPYRNDFLAPDWGRPEPEAARILAKELVEARSSGCVDRVLWFSFYGGDYGSFALVRPDGSPSLPLAAFCATRAMLAGSTALGDGKRGPGVASRRFRTARGDVEVLWSMAGPATIRLPRGAVATDLYGFPVPTRGAERALRLSASPVTIVGR